MNTSKRVTLNELCPLATQTWATGTYDVVCYGRTGRRVLVEATGAENAYRAAELFKSRDTCKQYRYEIVKSS